MLVRLLLIGVYPMLWLTRIGWWWRGRDPLRLREPEGSCWIERAPEPPAHTYFSESDVISPPSMAAGLLARAAGAFAPADEARDHGHDARALPDEIPDEVYTLW